MKTLFVVLIFTLMLSPSVFGQDRQDMTEGWLNGRGWETFERLQKHTYIEGFYQGVLVIEDDLLQVVLPNQRKLIAERAKAYLVRQKLSDLVVQIDDFYKDRANVRIPVVKAVLWIGQKNTGKSTQELDDLVVGYRRRWNK